MSTHSHISALDTHRIHGSSLWSDLFELTKPRITFFIMISAAVSFVMATTYSFDWITFIHLMIGTGFTSAGTAALNMYFERNYDFLMKRTKNRPLPSGRLEPQKAFIFGVAISVFGVVYCYVTINPLTSFLAFLTWASYLFIYTPSKRKTSLNTVIGAVPGAIPALGGWSAVTNDLGLGAWILFAFLFFWQFPHFLALAWLYRDDYAKGGYAMLSKMNDDGLFLSWQLVLYTIGLMIISLLPSVFGFSGWLYFISAVIFGIIFIHAAVRFTFDRSIIHAKKILYLSFIYPIILWAVLIFDKL